MQAVIKDNKVIMNIIINYYLLLISILLLILFLFLHVIGPPQYPLRGPLRPP